MKKQEKKEVPPIKKVKCVQEGCDRYNTTDDKPFYCINTYPRCYTHYWKEYRNRLELPYPKRIEDTLPENYYLKEYLDFVDTKGTRIVKPALLDLDMLRTLRDVSDLPVHVYIRDYLICELIRNHNDGPLAPKPFFGLGYATVQLFLDHKVVNKWYFKLEGSIVFCPWVLNFGKEYGDKPSTHSILLIADFTRKPKELRVYDSGNVGNYEPVVEKAKNDFIELLRRQAALQNFHTSQYFNSLSGFDLPRQTSDSACCLWTVIFAQFFIEEKELCKDMFSPAFVPFYKRKYARLILKDRENCPDEQMIFQLNEFRAFCRQEDPQKYRQIIRETDAEIRNVTERYLDNEMRLLRHSGKPTNVQ